MNNEPLISCLCLSYRRPAFLRNAIACFLSQTYFNKELIIIGHNDDNESVNIVASFNAPDIKYFTVPHLPIGHWRNIAVERSAGTYFCQWDDDDWHHNDRLKV